MVPFNTKQKNQSVTLKWVLWNNELQNANKEEISLCLWVVFSFNWFIIYRNYIFKLRWLPQLCVVIHQGKATGWEHSSRFTWFLLFPSCFFKYEYLIQGNFVNTRNARVFICSSKNRIMKLELQSGELCFIYSLNSFLNDFFFNSCFTLYHCHIRTKKDFQKITRLSWVCGAGVGECRRQHDSEYPSWSERGDSATMSLELSLGNKHIPAVLSGKDMWVWLQHRDHRAKQFSVLLQLSMSPSSLAC